MIIMDRRDYEILSILDEDGGFTTHHVAHSVSTGMTNKRRHSALIYRRLYSLSTAGLVKEMDNQKPICWVRTSTGTATLKAAQ